MRADCRVLVAGDGLPSWNMPAISAIAVLIRKRELCDFMLLYLGHVYIKEGVKPANVRDTLAGFVIA
jgi:hypothetical protein